MSSSCSEKYCKSSRMREGILLRYKRLPSGHGRHLCREVTQLAGTINIRRAAYSLPAPRTLPVLGLTKCTRPQAKQITLS